MKIKSFLILFLLVSLLALGGCKTAQPVVETGVSPAAGDDAYPVPQAAVTIPASEAYPAPDSGEGPAGAPVRPNASLMNVTILSILPDEKDSTQVILHVTVNTSQPANGLEEYNPGAVGQELDIRVSAQDAANLAVGNVINLTVSYRGDEWGGGYYGSGISLEM